MSTPTFRPALERIPAYKPGKPPSLGHGLSYKLASNENPYPPLPGVIERVLEAAQGMNRYPDMGVAALHAALAEKYGVEVLYHLLTATCTEGDEVVYGWRAFEAYPIAVGLTGATSTQVPLTSEGR